jgi:hypothetical protein
MIYRNRIIIIILTLILAVVGLSPLIFVADGLVKPAF